MRQRDLTDDEAQMLRVAARSVFERLRRAAQHVCERNDLALEDYFAQVIVIMVEAIAFGAIANYVKPESYDEVVNSLSGGLRAGLTSYREQLEKPVKYDA